MSTPNGTQSIYVLMLKYHEVTAHFSKTICQITRAIFENLEQVGKPEVSTISIRIRQIDKEYQD